MASSWSRAWGASWGKAWGFISNLIKTQSNQISIRIIENDIRNLLVEGDNRMAIYNINKNAITPVQDVSILFTTLYNSVKPIETYSDITLVEDCNTIKIAETYNDILIKNKNIKIALID